MHEKFSSDLFIDRTIKIIEQYSEAFSTNPENRYDITLSINCLYGLLMMPLKKYFKNISEKEVKLYLNENNIDDNQIYVNAISKESNQNIDISFKEMLMGIRNGLAHWEENNADYGNTGKLVFNINTSDIVENIIIEGEITRKGTGRIIVSTKLNVHENYENAIKQLIKIIPIKNPTTAST